MEGQMYNIVDNWKKFNLSPSNFCNKYFQKNLEIIQF